MLKNSFKNALRKKSQLVGLSVLVALLAMVLSLLTSINARVLRSDDLMKNASNLHNVVLQMDPYDRVPNDAGGEGEFNQESYEYGQIKSFADSVIPANNVAAQQYIIDELQSDYYRQQSDLQFYWSRTEGRQFSQVFNKGNNLTIKVLTKTTLQNDIPNQAVDKLLIFDGRDLENDRDVVVDAVFAEKNRLKLGDIVRIQKDNYGDQLLVGSPLNKDTSKQPDLEVLEKDVKQMEKEGLKKSDGVYAQKYEKAYDWYQIVGFGGSADFTMPVIDQNSPVPNRYKEALFYIKPDAFGLSPVKFDNGKTYYNYDSSNGRLTITSNSEWESFYSLKMVNGKTPDEDQMAQLNNDFNKLLGPSIQPKTYLYALGDKNYRYANRTDALVKVINLYNISTSILEILIAVVVFYSLGLIIRKQIDKSRGQIGVLKASGYGNGIIMFNFVMTPFFASFIGGIVGFALGGGLSSILVNEFMDYFILDYGQAFFSWPWFLLTIFGLWFILTAIALLITAIVLRKSPLDLVQGNRKVKLSKHDMAVKARFADHTTGQKVRLALFLDAKGKMSVVGGVVLLATIMFTVSFAAPSLLRRNEKMTYSGVNYKQVVEYNESIYNNPLTFYKTFNDSAPEDGFDNTFKYSVAKDSFSALPLLPSTSSTSQYGKYDLDKIIQAYYQNQMSSHYYSLELSRLAQSSKTAPLPNITLVNMKFLSGQNIASSTEYYRFMSKYGMPGGGLSIITETILKQWPDYVALNGKLGAKTNDPINNFKALQSFYAKLTNSIGLSITNTYYDTSNTTDAPWWNMTDDQKIASFNEGGQSKNPATNLQTVWTNTQKEQKSNWNSKLWDNLTIPEDFGFTNNEYGVGAFRILPPQAVKPSEYLEDYYLTVKAEDLSEADLNTILSKFVIWYGSLVSNRPDQGIVQAAYSRPPYFVQQFLKEAYQNETTYNQSFGVVSYNPELEQTGTLMRVRDQKGSSFKIYGTKENNPYMNLFDKKNNNLLKKLYESNIDQSLVINKSLAKRLKLKVGDSIPLTVLQKELKANGETVNMNQWNLGKQRNVGDDDGKFTQINNLSNNDVSLSVGGKKLKLFPGLLSPNDPAPYYEAILNNTLVNEDLETNLDFKVVGIHEGYGESQAWMKEAEVKKILQLDKMDDYNWKNFFSWQWGSTFASDWKINGETISGDPNLDLTNGKLDYQDFLTQYVKSDKADKRKKGRIINQIFHNAFPIFNYKYSNKDDIGDLKSIVATYQPYGDYSPIAMQGITANGTNVTKSYDGMGEGAMNNIIPTATSKAILAQISDLVMLILILAIVAILLIAFVIILLTTSLIIDDNSRFIATLKVLGYSNPYIVKTVLGMYFVLIAVVYIVGFIIGWFVYAAIINSLVASIVLPIYFPIWLPFAVAGGIIGVYGITIAVGFNSISKTNPIFLLQTNAL
ncbi:putative ABC transport system permease protein [Entomoplasma freundtii]|uniref:ABC transporter permease n=1 Tax=Entomoplasma freundtii TaxID=74700 RepID=A0A2K8NV16_9MOLU|nr:FtsX-like permease family protein [Entomoplasma freundtii]ATZ16601.1 ABC transporter permease [Entomoplasma freundtii]TDY58233.1 putative ABC transport system permease protein [Entomoplasma freundtii]